MESPIEKTKQTLSGSSEKDVEEYYRLQANGYHNKYYADDEGSSGAEIELLQNTFRDRDVLEIACGTGFWTEKVAQSATSVVATDINLSMIEAAGKRLTHLDNILFKVSDAYSLSNVAGKFNGAFAVLFWCHIPRERRREFLSVLCSKLEPGSPVVFVDQLSDIDEDTHFSDQNGNKFAERRAAGNDFAIIKNIPDRKELLADLKDFAAAIQYNKHSSGFWSVSWRTV